MRVIATAIVSHDRDWRLNIFTAMIVK